MQRPGQRVEQCQFPGLSEQAVGQRAGEERRWGCEEVVCFRGLCLVGCGVWLTVLQALLLLLGREIERVESRAGGWC